MTMLFFLSGSGVGSGGPVITIKHKTSGAFVDGTIKHKVGGTFLTSNLKHKTGGAFVP